MTFSRWTGTAWQALTTYKRWTGTAWQVIANGKRWNGASWVSFGFLQASLSPTSVIGTRNTVGTIHTSSCTTTASNGSGSYTYAWNVTTTSGPSIFADSPTSASTTFSSTLNGTTPTSLGNATCTVTDTASGASVVTSNTVSIDIEYTGP